MNPIYVYDPYSKQYIEGEYTITERSHIDEMSLYLSKEDHEWFSNERLIYRVFYDPRKNYGFRVHSEQVKTIMSEPVRVDIYLSTRMATDIPEPLRNS